MPKLLKLMKVDELSKLFDEVILDLSRNPWLKVDDLKALEPLTT